MQLRDAFLVLNLFVCLASYGLVAPGRAAQPNVILIVTDDQGYGDWGFKGKHPYLKTPAMDGLAWDGIFLTDFHVNPLCAPTRASIMTGRNPFAVRCWQGRHQLRADVPTLGNVFDDNDYATGLFGKWHLGDNYPFRAMDRGFQETVTMSNGMVTTANDYPMNVNLMDNHWKHNGVWQQYKGYSTDVWFEEATKFIEANRSKPFFVYIAPDAPHDPHIAPDSDAAPYKGIDFPNADRDERVAQFYGQIASVDRKLQDLRDRLDELKLTENTILIFMGDNGSAAASAVWNGGLTGGKGAIQEGGHRVPFFVHWPAGGLAGGREIDTLAAHVDLIPTLIDLCGLNPPAETGWDGVSLAGLLKGEVSSLPSRTVHLAYALGEDPPAKIGGCFARDKYRMFGNGAFFDVAADPLQKHNIGLSDLTPGQRAIRKEMAAAANAHHELMKKTVYPFDDPSVIGHAAANPTTLSTMYGRKDGGAGYAFMPTVNNAVGRFHRLIVKAAVAGEYQVTLYRWPQIWKWIAVPIRDQVGKGDKYSIDARHAFLQFTDRDGTVIYEATEAISPTAFECKFTVPSLPSNTQLNLNSWFIDGDGQRICTPIEIKIHKTM
jgi:arylsulfatase A-like enzyme